MARTADHDARRLQMSEAAIGIALDEGVGRLTVAKVAQAAGVSVGLVQHYFPSKHELMRRVHEDLLDRVNGRVWAIVEDGEARGLTIREMVVQALAELLPGDPERLDECRVRSEFESLALRDEALQRTAADSDRALRARLEHVVRNGLACGETDEASDPRQVAEDLWSATVGAARVQTLDPSYPASTVLERAAGRAFPHECRRHS